MKGDFHRKRKTGSEQVAFMVISGIIRPYSEMGLEIAFFGECNRKHTSERNRSGVV
jgi:hypothetical protein